ncbi:hypothetical protein D3C86_1750440 [compost metagenome]
MQALADPGHALHDAELCQAGLGQLQEAPGLEWRIDRGHFAGDVLEALGVEDFLEGRRLLVSHGGSLAIVVDPSHRVIVHREQARSHRKACKRQRSNVGASLLAKGPSNSPHLVPACSCS